MTDIISTLGLHGLPELFRLPNDIDHFKGSKVVIAIMAPNRTHPEFANAERMFAGLGDSDDFAVLGEDQADGPLHAKFHCGPDEFCFAVLDKDGNPVMRSDTVPTMEAVREHLHRGASGVVTH